MRSTAIGLALVGSFLAACSGAPTPTLAPRQTPAAGPSSAPSPAAATRVEVELTDSFRMAPTEIRVRAGVPVTFVVTNTGMLPHEFYLGDEDAQGEHETEMASTPGMTHDEPEGIGLEAGQTKELTYTFAASGSIIAGCHVPGHYAAGMQAVIMVE
jgi:uncharacterized cupredoxin-like copper-binding protein